MEALIGILFTLLMFVSGIALAIFVILLLWKVMKNKGSGLKTSVIGAGVSFGVLLISFIVVIAMVAKSPVDSKQLATNDKQEETQTDQTKEDDVEESNEKEEVPDEVEETPAENQNKVEEKEQNEPEVNVTPPKNSSKDEEKPDQNSNQVPVTFVRVVDGDTIRVIYNGKEEAVRYLLIDTPETKSPSSCVQPYGKEASARNEELLKSGNVTLEFEKSERDKYDRLLAYVFVDGKSVQETLLEEGLARVAYIYEPPYKYLDDYNAAEQRAIDDGLNIWSNSGYATEKGFSGCVNDTNNDSKSNSGSQKEPPTKTETPTKNETTTPQKEIFKNCTELRKVYPDGVGKGHPAYQSKMDRDKDNWACERAA